MNKILILLFFISFSTFSQDSLFVGKVSYYHKKFDGRRTANGEIFNNNSFTCAHMTYPFGTMLEIENPFTCKKVIVRVNDRGPYNKKRVLDVTYKTAKILGFLDRGVITLNGRIINKNG